MQHHPLLVGSLIKSLKTINSLDQHIFNRGVILMLVAAIAKLCLAIGYYPNMIKIPNFEHIKKFVVYKALGVSKSSAVAKKILERYSKNYLTPWHFYPQHRIQDKNGLFTINYYSICVGRWLMSLLMGMVLASSIMDFLPPTTTNHKTLLTLS